MVFNNIKIEKKEGIAIIKINRPQVLNALNKDTITELSMAVEELDTDKNIKVVILTGEGDKAFIAGADIKYMANMTPLDAKKFSELGHNMLMKIENSRLPFIAAIKGLVILKFLTKEAA